MIRRHPNYIWEQLGDKRLVACIISDGHHLPASVIRSVVRTKSTLHTIITCDSAGLAGCPPGRYQIESGEVEILPEGRSSWLRIRSISRDRPIDGRLRRPCDPGRRSLAA